LELATHFELAILVRTLRHHLMSHAVTSTCVEQAH
jgi:hypothetical protein